MTKRKKIDELSKTSSTLMRDINRIRKQTESQARMNILRKHQITLLNDFIKKLLKEGKISKEELEKYNIKKKDAVRKLFR